MNRIMWMTGLACTCLLVSESVAVDKKKIEKELFSVPRPEMAARAAELVRLAPLQERAETASIAVQVVASRHPAAAEPVAAAVAKVLPKPNPSTPGANQGQGGERPRERPHTPPGHENENGPGNGKGHANGGVGLGPGPNKPGRVIIDDKPINPVLPNGKLRHFPPTPPKRPVTPPRPFKYNHPRHP